MEGGFLTTALYPQPSKRSPLGPGGTEPGSNCTEGDQRGESDREVPAWVPLLGKHSSVLAWRIPGTGEPGGLPSVGSHRVRHA